MDASLAHMVLQLLDYDPGKRLTAAAALMHPFFDALSPTRTLAQVRHATTVRGRGWCLF